MDRWIERQTDRQTGRVTERQTGCCCSLWEFNGQGRSHVWKAHVPQGRPLLFFRAVSRTARECEHTSYPTICFPTDVKVGMAGAGGKAATRHFPGQALFWSVSGFAVTKNLRGMGSGLSHTISEVGSIPAPQSNSKVLELPSGSQQGLVLSPAAVCSILLGMTSTV